MADKLSNPSGWLIRHAQSMANTGASVDPHLTPLSPVGKQQAQWLAKHFNSAFPTSSNQRLSIIITSALPRTHETIAPLLSRQPALEHKIWPIHELVNLPKHVANGNDPALKLQAIKTYWETPNPYESADEDTESFIDFIARVDNFIESMRQSNHQRMIICSHGIFLTAVRWRILSFPLLSSEKQTDSVAFMSDFGQYLHRNMWKNSEFRAFSVNDNQMIRIKKPRKPPSFPHHFTN